MEWTDETIQRLTRLWDDGFSANEIAVKMNTSKSSILGKVHRLNLPARLNPVKQRGDGSDAPKRIQEKPARLPRPAGYSARAILEKKALQPAPAPIVNISAKCCWPMGNPRNARFRYCDEATSTGKSYCDLHRHVSAHGWDDAACQRTDAIVTPDRRALFKKLMFRKEIGDQIVEALNNLPGPYIESSRQLSLFRAAEIHSQREAA